jgi:hypothetical protein
MFLFRAARIVLLLLTCIIALGVALFTLLTAPEYTDEEIRQSFVDTWEPSALVTYLVLCVLAFFALLALVVGIFGKGPAERLLATAAILLTLGAAALEYRSHEILTERTTAITGQEFGLCNGLC